MLASLSIRNFLLIDRLDLEFGPGLCVLTGETGAGKSILLDALGLATGARAEGTGRAAAVDGKGDAKGDAKGDTKGDGGRAAITASFDVPPDHPVLAEIRDREIADVAPGEPLVLRRTLGPDGRTRAFVNDQPVSVAALRAIGDRLVEIEGQFGSHGLLDAGTHGALLDTYAGLGELVAKVNRAWDARAAAARQLSDARAGLERLSREADYLRHVHRELAEIDPQPDEESGLVETRTLMMNGEKIAEAVRTALDGLTGEAGVHTTLARAVRQLSRMNEQAAGRLGAAVDALDRTASEAADAAALLDDLLATLDHDPARLEAIEERLFALRALARKHQTDVGSLAALRDEFGARLALLDRSDADIAALERRVAETRAAYAEAADELSRRRRRAAKAIDRAVGAELPPLRLEKAVFRTEIAVADGGAGGETGGRDGIDRVRFLVAANPGQPPGPVDRVASGGELARLLLALKVVLTRGAPVDTLVFDEVDSGVGGATASAVAERLYRLAGDSQVLVVTHSPQVAARGSAHFRVQKSVTGKGRAEHTVTSVASLDAAERREEIARMLAGARITDEARAAADSLIAEATA